jgi:hypothetical protein
LFIGLSKNATLVVGNLLDYECPKNKNVIKGLNLSSHSLIRVEPNLVEECEERYASFVSSQSLLITMLLSNSNFYMHESLLSQF